MNLLLLTGDDRLREERFVVRDRRHLHLTSVLKVEVGRLLRVGLWDGPTGSGRVVDVAPDRTEIEVEWTGAIPERPRVHLILAIPRPKSLKKLLPQIVALGVGHLTLLRSWRVAQPYLSSPILQPEVMRPLIADGLMQAGCTRPPKVESALRFQPFVDDIGAKLDAPTKLVCHPRAERTVSTVRPGEDPAVVAIGPEGGWIDYELDAFVQAGFKPVSLGHRVLRVETACVALLANLSLLRTFAPESRVE